MTVPVDVLLAALSPGGRELTVALDAPGWTELLRLASLHRVQALLYTGLQRRGRLAPLVPVDVRDALRVHAHATAVRNLRLIAETDRLAAALAARGVPVIALKGIHLANAFYRSPGLREMLDVDVLVRRADVPAAAAWLADDGYRPLTPYDLALDLDAAHHLTRHLKGDYGVEVHWGLAPLDTPTHVPVEDVWRRARPFSLGRREVLGLGVEDLLVHLAHHAVCQHGFAQGLRPIVDAARVLAAAPAIDGARLRAIATRSGTPRAVTLLVGLARRYLGAPPVAGYADTCPASLLEVAMADVLSGPEADRVHPKLARGPGFAGAIRLAWQEVLVPRAELARVVGRSPHATLLPVFYGVRALRLARRHGGAIARHLLGRGPQWADVPARRTLYAWIEDAAES